MGYGPGGVGLLIQVVTTNRNRIVGEFRHMMSKNGGNMAEAGAVGWMFSRKGEISVPKEGRTVSGDPRYLKPGDASLNAALDLNALFTVVELLRNGVTTFVGFTDAGAKHLPRLKKLKGLEIGTRNATPACLGFLVSIPL